VLTLYWALVLGTGLPSFSSPSPFFDWRGVRSCVKVLRKLPLRFDRALLRELPFSSSIRSRLNRNLGMRRVEAKKSKGINHRKKKPTSSNNKNIIIIIINNNNNNNNNYNYNNYNYNYNNANNKNMSSYWKFTMSSCCIASGDSTQSTSKFSRERRMLSKTDE
jgi:hypothetical protein